MPDIQSLTPVEQEFIKEHAQAEPAQLLLQKNRYRGLDVPKLVHYIQARQKVRYKLPQWYNCLDIVYPTVLSLEQSSSELTAQYKAGLVSGNTLIDLTGGFGIDSFFFAQHFAQVHYVEQNPELTAIAAYNAGLLGNSNIQFHNALAADFLKDFNGKADCIYLDPARRGTANQKLHFLSDCEPDVLDLLPLLFQKANQVLLKTSPMLDIEQARQQLSKVSKILVVAVDNECKEVLYLVSENAPPEPTYEAVNLHSQKEATIFRFNKSGEETATITYSEPQPYIYEPNTAILKAGGFKSVAEQYELNKLHRNSHLYTSHKLISDFPGRIFKCLAVSKYQKKEVLAYLPEKKANITVRNFPEPVAAIRKKLGLQEGGNIYLLATTDVHQKAIILVCEKAL
ncbi:MAG: class I SAM-dependent methyltransferase [Bacteroidota bacterium]|nr:class I SAM-dependent methyltransferase [Bacteroidota bacterium]